MTLRDRVKRVPGLGTLAVAVKHRLHRPTQFGHSGEYWDQRYFGGGNSGAGSYGPLAEFKAEFINALVQQEGVQTVIEFGCGDGNQLRLAAYPEYSGYDVSPQAVQLSRSQHAADPTKSFDLVANWTGKTADLTLSLDVIYHLVEDDVYEEHMRILFAASNRLVVVYSSNTEDQSISHSADHVRHRRFTDWVEANLPEWKLAMQAPNAFPYGVADGSGSFADFFVFYKSDEPQD